MEHFYYDRIEKKDPDPTLNRIGTEYYRGLNHELLDSVKFGKHWIPLLDELFTELDEIWYNHPNKLVRRFGKQVARTPKEVLEEGAQIVADIKKTPIEMLGHVTSSYYSPNLKKSIALGVVKGGKNMMGQKLIIPMENKQINVTVADPVFLDKENKRLNA